MTIDTIKNYCHLDDSYEDELLLKMYKTAELYLFELTGKVIDDAYIEDELYLNVDYEYFSAYKVPIAELYLLAMTLELFEQRGMTAHQIQRKNYVFQNLLNSLQY